MLTNKRYPHGLFLDVLFKNFSADGVLYCVLRNWQDLPNDCGNDLDVFVSKENVVRACRLIISLGAKHNLVLRRKTIKYGYVSLLLHNWETLEEIKIDFFHIIHFQGLETISHGEVLSDTRVLNSIVVANESVANFINMYKDFLSENYIKEKYRKIKEKKITTKIEDLCKGYPDELRDYCSYCRKLKFKQTPDYKYLRSLFKSLFKKLKFEYDYQYDWVFEKQ